jgi:hypothetical protein
MKTPTTNFLVAVYLARKFEPDWKACVRLFIQVNLMRAR